MIPSPVAPVRSTFNSFTKHLLLYCIFILCFSTAAGLLQQTNFSYGVVSIYLLFKVCEFKTLPQADSHRRCTLQQTHWIWFIFLHILVKSKQKPSEQGQWLSGAGWPLELLVYHVISHTAWQTVWCAWEWYLRVRRKPLLWGQFSLVYTLNAAPRWSPATRGSGAARCCGFVDFGSFTFSVSGVLINLFTWTCSSFLKRTACCWGPWICRSGLMHSPTEMTYIFMYCFM